MLYQLLNDIANYILPDKTKLVVANKLDKKIKDYL